MMSRWFGRSIPALVLVIGLSTQAVAQSAAEKIAQGWFSSLREMGADASYGGLEYDSRSKTLTVRDAKLSWTFDFSNVGGPAITISGHSKTLSYTDLARTSDGYVYSAFSASDGAFLKFAGTFEGQSGHVTFAFDGYTAKDVFQPELPRIAEDPSKPVSRFLPILQALVKQEASSSRITRMSIEQDLGPAGTSTTAYNNIWVKNMVGGRVEEYGVESVEQTGKVAFEPGKLLDVKLTSGRQIARGMDMARMIWFLDPGAHTAGQPDGKAYSVLESAFYENVVYTIPNLVNAKLAKVSVKGWRIKQPSVPILPMIDRLVQGDKPSDKEMAEFVLALFAMYNFDQMELAGISAASPGPVSGKLASIRLQKVGEGRIGQLAVDGFHLNAQGGIGFDLQSFSIEDVRLPGNAAIFALIAAEKQKRKPNAREIMNVLPMVGSIAIHDFLIRAPGNQRVSLKRFEQVLSKFIAPIPTDIRLSLKDLAMPVALIEDRDSVETLTALGFKHITLSEDLVLNWNELSQDLTLSNLKVELKDGGALTVSAVLGGLPRSVIENPETAQVALATLSVKALRIEYTDASLVDRVMKMQAGKMKITPDQMRNQVAASIPAILAAIGNPDFAGKVSGELDKFIRQPGKLVITAKPANPVPVMQLVGAGTTAPHTLPDILNVTVRAE